MLGFFFDYVLTLSPVWQIIIFILSLGLGLFILIKGADIFVDNASLIAKKLKIPSLIIGLTIVSFGTSAPETSVSISSALNNAADLSVGNVVGSNIFNLLIVLGVSLLFTSMVVKKETLKRDVPFMLIISILLMVFALFFGENHTLILVEGIILVVVFTGYIVYSIIDGKKEEKKRLQMGEVEVKEITPEEEKKQKRNGFVCVLLLAIGLVGIIAGGELVTFGAKNISLKIGISENLVGLTVVAIGTSLPELMTSVIASKKGENDIALGNVIGSNIYNTGLILGVSAILTPTPISMNALIDIIVMVSIFVVFMILIIFRRKLGKVDGGIMIGVYLCYFAYIIIRDFVVI